MEKSGWTKKEEGEGSFCRILTGQSGKNRRQCGAPLRFAFPLVLGKGNGHLLRWREMIIVEVILGDRRLHLVLKLDKANVGAR